MREVSRNKIQDLRSINKAAEIYKDILKSKIIMYVYHDINTNNLCYYEVEFLPGHFQHLTGTISTNPNVLKPVEFFNAASENRLRVDDFQYKDKTSYIKLDNLQKGIYLPIKAQMIGSYLQQSPLLQLDKVAGSVKLILGFDIEKCKEIAFPKSFLIDDIRNRVIGKPNKIMVIFRKNNNEKLYNNITYIAKNIDIYKLDFPEKIKQKIDIKNMIFDKTIHMDLSGKNIAIEKMLFEAGFKPTDKLVKDLALINNNIKELQSITELKDMYKMLNSVIEDFKDQERLEIITEKLSQQIKENIPEP